VEEGGPREAGPGERRHLAELHGGEHGEQRRERRQDLERVEQQRVAARLDRDAPPGVEQRGDQDEREGGEAQTGRLAE
jgi:hypothetical protein